MNIFIFIVIWSGTHQRQDMVQLTKQVIESVSKELNYPFVNDRQLFTNLFAHLSLRFTKKHLFINEYNPFSKKSKENTQRCF